MATVRQETEEEAKWNNKVSANRPTSFPILDWFFGYQKEWLRWDLIAGLITAAVVIPKAMAYATIAGLPVQVGLYTALVPMVIYAVVGTSRPLSVSTTTTLAILAAAQLSQFAPDGDPASLMRASATLTFLVGAILVLASLLRLGFIANFISEPVLIGFKAGIALVIVLDQVPKLLGIHFPKGTFIHNLLAIVQTIPDTSLPTLAVGIVMILLLFGLEHFFPRAPAPLIVVAIAIASVRLFGLEAYGVESVGEIPRGLPSFTFPDFSLVAQLWPGALGIALMSFTETIAAGRAFATSEEPHLRPNQELAGDRACECGRRVPGRHASGRRHLADRGQPSCGCAHAVGGAGHGGGRAADDALPRPPHRVNAASHPCGRGHHLLDRVDQSGGLSPHSRDPTNGVPLGLDRPRWRGAAGDFAGDPRRHRGLPGGLGAPDSRSAGPRARAQAGHECFSAPFEGAPRG